MDVLWFCPKEETTLLLCFLEEELVLSLDEIPGAPTNLPSDGPEKCLALFLHDLPLFDKDILG